MNRFLCIAVVIFLWGCGGDDPCSEFISVDDIRIKEQHDNFPRRIEKEVVVPNADALHLEYMWEVNGLKYEGRKLELEGEGQQSGLLTVSNAGCKISKEILFDFEIPLGYIGGKVWLDSKNQLGFLHREDDTDSHLSGVQVNLLDASTFEVLDTSITRTEGHYYFNRVVEGEYILEFERPSSFLFVPQFYIPNADDGNALNSYVNENGLSEVISLDAGGWIHSINVGYYKPDEDDSFYLDCSQDTLGSISGKAWKDSHYFEGGIVHAYDESDLIAPEIKVELIDANSLEIIEETMTDQDGNYAFQSVIPADYILKFYKWEVDRPFYWLDSELEYGETIDCDVDEDGYTDKLEVRPCQHYTNIDAGFKICFEGDDDCLDLDHPCTYFPTVDEVEFDYWNRCTSIFLSAEFPQSGDLDNLMFEWSASGFGEFSSPSFSIPREFGDTELIDVSLIISDATCSVKKSILIDPSKSSIIGNQIWKESFNGHENVYDASDDVIEGVRVELLSADTQELIQFTTSDEFGRYILFVEEGEYMLHFVKPNITDVFVEKGHGDEEAEDSDVDSNGYTDRFFVEDCEINLKFDAGFR